VFIVIFHVTRRARSGSNCDDGADAERRRQDPNQVQLGKLGDQSYRECGCGTNREGQESASVLATERASWKGSDEKHDGAEKNTGADSPNYPGKYVHGDLWQVNAAAGALWPGEKLAGVCFTATGSVVGLPMFL